MIFQNQTFALCFQQFPITKEVDTFQRKQMVPLGQTLGDFNNNSVGLMFTRRLQAIATIMYKVIYGLAPPYIADLFVFTNSQYHLRNSDFAIPIFRTVTYGKHSLTYLGPVIWSKLDKSIRSSESLDTFKKRINTVNFTFVWTA